MHAPAPATRSRLTRREWRAVGGMSAVVVGLHVVGWGVLLGVVVPAHYVLGSQVFGLGLGVTAYSLGMRHAFDADHIAAIDNTTRKLMAEGRRPLSVGFWFSLGHSSVVTAMFVLLAAGVRALAGQVEDKDSTLQHVTGVVGVAVSGTFLLLIGLVNVGVLRGILGVWRGMRAGSYDEAALEAHLNNRGFLARLLGRVTRAVGRPWHMYPVGLLFGLGFDTTTEVSLMVLAGGTAAFALPWYAVLTLPVLFAAGMSLLDTVDGSFMNFAYGWAFSQPVRKVYYNLTVTGLSVAVALIIGGIELISIAVDKLHVTSGPLAAVGGLNMDSVGYAILGLFALTWAGAVLVWRFGRIEQRWGPRPAPDSAG
jgi:high-affinity nickel-transport protein